MLELEFFLYAVREVGAREKLAQRYDGIRRAITVTLKRHFEEMAWSRRYRRSSFPGLYWR